MNLEEQLSQIVGTRLLLNEPMSKHTNFRIGGNVERFVVVETRDELVAVLQAIAESNTEFFVLGGGSNTLVADEGYRGTVIQIALRSYVIKNETVTAEAGVPSILLARQTVEAGLSGFEWAIGLPGTIGGAVRGNAGCYGGEMKDVVSSVEVFVIKDIGSGAVGIEREEWTNADCAFAYRDSKFKHLKYPPIIVSVTLRLAPGDKEAGKKRMQEILTLRKEKQPLQNSSAGCIFKNYEFEKGADLSRIEKVAEIPQVFLERGSIGSAWLIDKAGLKGLAVNDAEVSEKHGNFCVNKGHATAKDVRELVKQVKQKVQETLGLELHEEIQYLGF